MTTSVWLDSPFCLPNPITFFFPGQCGEEEQLQGLVTQHTWGHLNVILNLNLSFKDEGLRKKGFGTAKGDCYKGTKLLMLLHGLTHKPSCRICARCCAGKLPFFICLVSTCLQTMTIREMAWWHKCIHQGKRSENIGHMEKHAESNTSINNLFAMLPKAIPPHLFYGDTAPWCLPTHGART